MDFENYNAEDIYQQMNQHWCPRTLGAGLLTGAIYSHIFLFLKEVFFWCFVQIFLLRRTGLVLCPLQLPALTPGVLGALSAPTAGSIHGRELLVCAVLCARPGHGCRAGLTSSQHPAESTWHQHHLWLCMCHPGIQNHRCLPPVGCCSPPPWPTRNLFFLKFACVDFEETLYLCWALPWDVLFRCTCGT